MILFWSGKDKDFCVTGDPEGVPSVEQVNRLASGGGDGMFGFLYRCDDSFGEETGGLWRKKKGCVEF